MTISDSNKIHWFTEQADVITTRHFSDLFSLSNSSPFLPARADSRSCKRWNSRRSSTRSSSRSTSRNIRRTSRSTSRRSSRSSCRSNSSSCRRPSKKSIWAVGWFESITFSIVYVCRSWRPVVCRPAVLAPLFQTPHVCDSAIYWMTVKLQLHFKLIISLWGSIRLISIWPEVSFNSSYYIYIITALILTV